MASDGQMGCRMVWQVISRGFVGVVVEIGEYQKYGGGVFENKSLRRRWPSVVDNVYFQMINFKFNH